MNIFKVAESAMSDGKYFPTITEEFFNSPLGIVSCCSYGVLPSCVLGLDYQTYLVYCIKEYDATVIGGGYPHPIFSETNCRKLVALLNQRCTEICKKLVSKI